MEAENLVVNQGSQRQIVKEVREKLPDICIAVFPKTLVVKTIYLCNLTRFVVTTKDCNSGRVSNFERDEERNSLDRIVTSVDVIALMDLSALF